MGRLLRLLPLAIAAVRWLRDRRAGTPAPVTQQRRRHGRTRMTSR
ncbi:MAG TPA: hypothetical protein VGK35_08480 [Actinotalea sp.]